MSSFFKKKRAQAAIELLTTYGWAIIGVLVVIGALAYFDVFDAKRFVSERCDTGTQIMCTGSYIDDRNVFELEVKNNYLVPIDIMGVTVKTDGVVYPQTLHKVGSLYEFRVANIPPGNLTRFRAENIAMGGTYFKKGSKKEINVVIQFRRSAPQNIGPGNIILPCDDSASTTCYNITGTLVGKVQDYEMNLAPQDDG